MGERMARSREVQAKSSRTDDPRGWRATAATTSVSEAIGNQATARLLKPGAANPSRTMSHRGDASELEAERVSEAMAHGGARVTTGAASPYSLARELGAGQALAPLHRQRFEQHLGVGLEGVRVHVDPAAASTARAIGAQAYTVGRDIVFAPGQYAPHTRAGEKLLAHELAHVAQGAADGVAIHRQEAVCAEPANASMPEPAVCMPPPVAKALASAPTPIPGSHAGIASRLAEVQRLLRSVGVVSIERTKELRDEEVRLMTALASMQMYIGAVPSLLSLSKPGLVDWSAGNLRGLAAEPALIEQFYPGATLLPEKFPGFDALQGGDRSPMSGMHRGVPLNDDSFFASGGTLIQFKTLKNGDPGYTSNPGSITSTLKAGMDKMVNKFGPGTGRSQRIGDELFRVEHAGDPERMVMRVLLEQEPTPAQSAALVEAAEAATSLDIELVVTVSPKRPVLRMTPGTGAALAGLGVGLVGSLAKGVHAERLLEEEGYVPPGAGAYQNESLIIRLGSLVRGDVLAMPGDLGQVNMPVWRRKMKEVCDKKPFGATIVYSGFEGMEQSDFTYVKNSDGTWTFVKGPKGALIIPDLNLIIDPNASDAAVHSQLTTIWD